MAKEPTGIDKELWDAIFKACRERIDNDPDPVAPLRASMIALSVAAGLWHWKLRPGATQIPMVFDEAFFVKCATDMFNASHDWLPKD